MRQLDWFRLLASAPTVPLRYNAKPDVLFLEEVLDDCDHALDLRIGQFRINRQA